MSIGRRSGNLQDGAVAVGRIDPRLALAQVEEIVDERGAR
jgi:hypothetical protein